MILRWIRKLLLIPSSRLSAGDKSACIICTYKKQNIPQSHQQHYPRKNSDSQHSTNCWFSDRPACLLAGRMMMIVCLSSCLPAWWRRTQRWWKPASTTAQQPKKESNEKAGSMSDPATLCATMKTNTQHRNTEEKSCTLIELLTRCVMPMQMPQKRHLYMVAASATKHTNTN